MSIRCRGPAAVGPWNVDTKYEGNPTGDWVTYFADMLDEIADRGGRVELEVAGRAMDPRVGGLHDDSRMMS